MNRWTIALAALAIALGLTTAARAGQATYDYDRTVVFAHWKTFTWKWPETTGATMTERRLRRALEAGFVAKGYTLVADAAQADFLVAARANAWQDLQLEDRSAGPGFGRRLQLERTPMGALGVDVFDRRTRLLAWRGVVTEELAHDPAQADKRTAKAVTRLLKPFPACGPR